MKFEKPGGVIEGKIPVDVKKLKVFTITVVQSRLRWDSLRRTRPSRPNSSRRGRARIGGRPAAQITDHSAAAAKHGSTTLPFARHAQDPDGLPGGAVTASSSQAVPPDMPSHPAVFKPDAGSTQMLVQPANHPEQSKTTPDDRSQAKAVSNSTARRKSARRRKTLSSRGRR